MYDIEEVRAAVERHGWYVPCVLPDVPAGVTWAYTVGLSDAGLPELIVFGEWPNHAHAILGRTRDLLLRSPSRARPGEPLGTVHTRFGHCEARLGRVADPWMDRFPLWAGELYGPDVRVLQVVLSHGPDADVAVEDAIDLAHAQPDLSRDERPWSTPFFGTGWWDEPRGADVWVLVPIRCAGEDEHRDEAVPAERLDATTARLVLPPVLADHVTAGATVRIEAEPDGVLDHPSVGVAPTHRLVEVVDPGPNVQLSFGVAVREDERGERILGAVGRLLDRFEAPATVAHGSVHLAVAPRHAEPARIAFRRLERDGLVSALAPYHEPNVFTDHPDCPQCRKRRNG